MCCRCVCEVSRRLRGQINQTLSNLAGAGEEKHDYMRNDAEQRVANLPVVLKEQEYVGMHVGQ